MTVRLGYCCAVPGALKATRPMAAEAKTATRCSIESSQLLFFLGASLRCGNDRQQEVWLLAGGEMQRISAAENSGRPVVGIDMQKGADAFHPVRPRQRREGPA